MSRKLFGRLVLLFVAVFALTFLVMAQVAPSLIVTNDDAIIQDSNGDGLADSGDTIRYTVVLANCGSGVAENVQYRTDIDPNTQLDPDSITRSNSEPITDDVCGDLLENTDENNSSNVVEPNDPLAIVDASAGNDLISVTIGATNTGNVLSNDAGDAPVVVVSFGDSVANVGTTSADGVTVLSVTAGGGTVDVTVAVNGAINIDATTATGSGTISIFYLIQAGNGTTDIGQIDISYGDFPTGVDDTQTNGVTFSTNAGTAFNNTSTGYQPLLNNDTLGTPVATLVSFGGGSLIGDATTFTAPATGTVAGVGTLQILDNVGNFEFTPDAGFTGTFTFQYRLENSVGFSDGTVEIYVEEAPVAVADTYRVSLGNVDTTNNVITDVAGADDVGAPPAQVDFYANTGDIGGASQVAVGGTYTHPTGNFTVVIQADGSVTIDASGGTVTTGTYDFQYQITNTVGSSIATVTIEIVSGPIAEDDAFSLALGADLTLAVLLVPNPNPGGVADTLGTPPFDVLTFGGGDLGGTVTTNTATVTGTSVALAGGTLTITSGGGINLVGATTAGTYTFDYQLTSTALGQSDSATVTIVIDAPPTVTVTSPTDVDTNVADNATVDVTFSEDVNIAGDWITIICSVSGTFSPSNTNITVVPPTGPATSFVVTPTGGFAPAGETCNVTLVASQITDNDTDPTPETTASDQLDGDGDLTGGDDFTFSFSTADAAPTVTVIVPNDAATGIASDTTVDITFSENVDLNGNWVQLVCTSSGTLGIGTGLTSAPVAGPTTNPVITIAGGLVAGETCDVTILSNATNGVSDSDAIDPPNLLDGNGDGTEGDNFTSSFTVDEAITVTTVNPADTTLNVPVNSDIVVTFSEAPTLNGGWFTIACTVSNVTPANSAVVLAGNTATIDPTTDFAIGESCTLTVLSDATNGVTDADANDPPDLLDGNGDSIPGDNFVSTFSTSDNLPTLVSAEVERTGFVSTIPTADTIQNDTDIRLTFSEDVNFATGAFTVVCGTSGNVTANYTAGATPATVVTLTYGGVGLADGETCDVTLVSTAITDDDGVPPAQLDGNGNNTEDGIADNVTFSFTVDTSPRITSVQVEKADVLGDITVGTNDTDVDFDTTVVFNFSETINVPAAADWVTLTCTTSGVYNVTGTGGTAFASVVGDGTAQITLTLTSNFTPSETCTIAIDETLVTDTDAGDPPDTLLNYPDDTFTIISNVAPTVTNTQVEVGGVATDTTTTDTDADTTIVINFSESVDVTGAWFNVTCTVSGDVTAQFTASATPATSVTLTNSGTNLVGSETCTVTLDSALVTDNDTADPPNTLDGDADGDVSDADVATDVYSTTFTIDAPLQVDTVTPTNNSNNVSTIALTIDITFLNAPADVSATGVVLECGADLLNLGAIGFTAGLPASNVNNISLTPDTTDADFEPGNICRVTVVADQTTDSDASDPPNTLDGDFDGISEGSPTDDFVFIFELQPDTAPDTVNDLLGNVSYDSTTATFSVLDNDGSPAQALTITGPAGGNTTCGGFVSFNTTTGEFQYNPPAGYEGADSFTYTATTNGANSLGSSNTGTVTLNVTDMVWFVTNDATEFGTNGNDGRLSDPFQNLSAFATAQGGTSTATGAGCAGAGSEIVDPEEGDNIFIYDGTSDYLFASGLTLLSNQTLIGQGTNDGTVLTLANLGTGATIATGQPATAAPISSPVIPAQTGTNPNLNSTGGNSLALNGAGTANYVYGVDLEINQVNEIGLQGNGFGNLFISDVSIFDEAGFTSAVGRIMALNNGTFATGSNFGLLQSVDGNANIIFLTNMGGSFTTVATTIDQTVASGTPQEGISGIRITDSVAGSVFDFGVLNIFMEVGASTADNIAISGTRNNGAIIRTSGSASSSFTNLDGPVFNLDDTNLDIAVGTIRSSGSNSNGLFWDNVGGTLTASVDTTILNATTNGIEIQNTPSGATFDFGAATRVTTTGTGDGINLFTWDGTSATFGAAVISDAGNDGIELNRINSGTINFEATNVGFGAGILPPNDDGVKIQDSAATFNFNSLQVETDTTTGNGGNALLGTNNAGATVNVPYSSLSNLIADAGACIDFNNPISGGVTNLNIEFNTCTTTDSTNHGFRIGDGAGTLVAIRNTINIDMRVGASNNPILIENTTTTTINLADGIGATNVVTLSQRLVDGFRVDGFNGTNLIVGDYNDNGLNSTSGSSIKIQNSSGNITFRSTDITNTVESTPRMVDANLFPTNDLDDGHGIFLLDNTGTFRVLGTGFQGDGGLILDISNGSAFFSRPAAVEVRRANFSSVDLDVTMDVTANLSGPAVRIINPLPGSTNTVNNMTVQNIADRAGAFELRTNVNIDGTTLNLIDFDARSYVDPQASTVQVALSAGTVGTLTFNMTGTNSAATTGANCIIGNEGTVLFFARAGTLDLLVDSCRIDGPAPAGGDGFRVSASGVGAVVNANITNNFLLNVASVGIRLNAGTSSSGGTLNANVDNNTIDTSGGGIAWSGGGGGANFENSRVTISNNTLSNISAVGMSILMSSGYTGTFGDIRVLNNSITSNSEGILVGDGSGTSVLRLLLDNNTVTSATDDAIFVLPNTNIQITITNNILTGDDNDIDFTLNGGSTLCSDVQGNTFNNAVAADGFYSFNFGATTYQLTASSQALTTVIGAAPATVPDGTCELPTP